jgi:hypothetical protein
MAAEKEANAPMSMLETSIYVHPGFPVEFVVGVDATHVRVSIEWAAIQRLIGRASVNEEQVRGFLHDHRGEIASAIKAHLAAYGTPLTRQLTLSSKDLRLVGALGSQFGNSR